MSSAQRRRAYLRDEFHLLTLNATVQRARIYANGIAENEREAFRMSLRQQLDITSMAYSRPVGEREHIRNIERLAAFMSRRHGGILREGRFRIGPAQKALNLFLKYQWCAGWISEPPHCPFDARVIALLPAGVRVSWTDLDSSAGYRSLVRAARAVASSVSLPNWELAAYNALSNAARRTA
jgi:hypothetical protein